MSRNIKNELQDNSPINFAATSDLRTLAMRLHLSGNLFDAQQIYRQICDISPVTSEDYLNIALAQKFLGNLPEASLVFEKGILLNPDSPELYLSYGEFLNETERHEEALSIYEKASSIFESVRRLSFSMVSLAMFSAFSFSSGNTSEIMMKEAILIRMTMAAVLNP